MKKLMIAAALVAAMVGSASADCADPKPCEACLFGYKLQLVAKTTIGGNVSNAYAKVCDSCFRKPTMGKVVGYIFGKTVPGGGQCGDADCECNDWTDASIQNKAILLWKAWNKKALATDEVTFDRMDRIGYKDRSTVESVMTITLKGNADAKLTLAGFGKAAHMADGRIAIKNLSGFFAGKMLAYCSECEKGCGPEVCVDTVALYWTMCDDTAPVAVEDADPLTAAYGKWQMVWDPQLVARLTKQGVNSNTARPSAAYEPQEFDWDHE